jgi:hypothetical protein
MKTLSLLIAAALLSAPAFAHDDATLDKVKTPNGGQLRMAGAYHLELVVAKGNKEAVESPVFVYLTDHADNKIDAKGMSANAMLLAGKYKASTVLVPDGDNRLKGSAKYVSDPDMKVVITLKRPDGTTEQARFTPMAQALAHQGH